MSLRDQQLALVDALYGAPAPALGGDSHLGIYRNNLAYGAVALAEDAFLLTSALLGHDNFRWLAREAVLRCGLTGSLDPVAPKLLATALAAPELDDAPAVRDAARLEEALDDVRRAPRRSRLTGAALAAAADPMSARLELVPLRVLRLAHGLLDAWEAADHGAPLPDIAQVDTVVVVWSDGGEAHLAQTTTALADGLEALATGRTLGEVHDLLGDSAFGALLTEGLGAGWFHRLR